MNIKRWRLLLCFSFVLNVSIAHAVPIADAGGPYTVTTLNKTVNLLGTGTPDADPIVLYEWDFEGDGTNDWASAVTGNTTHTFISLLSVGDVAHPVFRVEDSRGESATQSTTVTFANLPPVADANGPYVINFGDALTLDASASFDVDGQAMTYSWDINGDGVFGDSTAVFPALTWADLVSLGLGAGMHEIGLQVDDGFGAIDSTTASLTINEAPVPEPTTLALMGLGLASIGYQRRRSKKTAWAIIRDPQ